MQLRPAVWSVVKGACLLMSVGMLAVAAVFSVGITTGHIGLDDWGYTGGCPFVAGGLTFANILSAVCDFGYGAIWMPATFASYMVDVTLFGNSWLPHHAVNVALHLLNAWLVYLFLMDQARMFVSCNGKVDIEIPCAVCAILWALHPMRTEAVVFVASRKEELWTLFSLCALLQYSAFLRDRRIVRYATSVAFYILAGMSKPTAMCVPFLMLAMHIMVLGVNGWRRLIWLLPLIALAAALGGLAVYSQSHPTSAVGVDVFEAALWWRLINAVVSIGLYFWYTLVPAGIHMDYRAVFNECPLNCALGIASLAVVAIGFATAVWRRGWMRHAALYSAILFFLSLGPALGVFGYVNGDQAMADRYTYFPHIAIALFAAVCIARLVPMLSVKARRCCFAAVLLVAVVEAIAAIPVVKSYENSYTAWARALEKDPDNWRALRIVGNEYCAKMGRMDEGIAMLRKSMKIRGSQTTADSLAYVLAIRGKPGDFDEVKRIGAPIAAKPSLDEGGLMLDALGIVGMRERRHADAARYFALGLSVGKRNHSRDFSELYLGLCLANTGKDAEAVRILSRLSKTSSGLVRRRAESATKTILRSHTRPPFEWE